MDFLKDISHLPILELIKQLSLASKKMHSLTLSRIWSKPKFEDDKAHKIGFLQKISKFPIHELHAKNFDCSWLEITALVPHLKLLHLDIADDGRKRFSPDESRLPYLKVPVAIYTNTFELKENKHFEELLKIMDSVKVKELVIDHIPRWPLERLKRLVGKVKSTQLTISCLEIYSENLIHFVEILTSFENCAVNLKHLGHLFAFS